jgi:virginiamycin A acetyltransferase
MKQILKEILIFVSQILAFPLALLSILEDKLWKGDAEGVFLTCAQIVAILPGLPGAFLRRAYYSLTLESCSNHCHIGFGTLISHRATIIDEHVYIGNYALIGSAHLASHTLIGSRVSILSGKPLHVLDEEGMWTPYSAQRLAMVKIEKNVWIGEGAIIFADIGEGCMIGAGSVVTSDIRPNIIVSGNPARFVKNLGSKD